MTEAQRTHLQKRLLEERARLERDLNRYRDGTRDTMQEQSDDLSHARLHPADEATDAFDQELDASNAVRQSRELAEIDAALERLYKDPDKFGLDENTGKEIAFARLDLVPWARTGT
ncbi:MAG: hypothetical protein M3081_15815 [Gemmatimonadota bacterium]|nr:hypothetical protein [Gemmatimonadota bacterium]